MAGNGDSSRVHSKITADLLRARAERGARVIVAAALFALGGVPAGCVQNSQGSGGGETNGCKSNGDCPTESPLCDSNAGQCVVCLTDYDCQPPGSCTQGVCVASVSGGANGGAPNQGAGGTGSTSLGGASVGAGGIASAGGDPAASPGGSSGAGGTTVTIDHGTCPAGAKFCMPGACYVANPANGCELGVGCAPCPTSPTHGVSTCVNGLCAVACLSGYSNEQGACVPAARPDSGT
jgi:hypothetical protein